MLLLWWTVMTRQLVCRSFYIDEDLRNSRASTFNSHRGRRVILSLGDLFCCFPAGE
jgi:hypothetical protein